MAYPKNTPVKNVESTSQRNFEIVISTLDYFISINTWFTLTAVTVSDDNSELSAQVDNPQANTARLTPSASLKCLLCTLSSPSLKSISTDARRPRKRLVAGVYGKYPSSFIFAISEKSKKHLGKSALSQKDRAFLLTPTIASPVGIMKAFLGGANCNVNSPIIHVEFEAANGTHSINE